MVRRRYGQFCPTAKALDVVGERWTLLLVRDLLLGPRRYSDLRRSMPGMASNLLADRLREMAAAGLVERRVDGDDDGGRGRITYELTDRGRGLAPVLHELARFGFPELGLPSDDEPLRPELVALGLVAMLHPAELPDAGLRIRFALDEGDHLMTIAPQGPPGRRAPVHERVTVEPMDAPADEQRGSTTATPDVTVRGSLATLLWIRQGTLTQAEARAQGLVEIAGDAAAITALGHLYRSA